MADKGSITLTCFELFGDLSCLRVNPSYFANTIADMAPDVSGIIRGIVTELGTPIPNCKVLLLYRPDGSVVQKTRTGDDGTYEFRSLIPQALYSVIALDPDGGTAYNDQIKSSVVPGS